MSVSRARAIFVSGRGYWTVLCHRESIARREQLLTRIADSRMAFDLSSLFMKTLYIGLKLVGKKVKELNLQTDELNGITKIYIMLTGMVHDKIFWCHMHLHHG